MGNGGGADGGKRLIPLCELHTSTNRADDSPPGKDRRLIFLSGTVYTTPLSPTVAKQMRVLGRFGRVTILGWAQGLKPSRLREPVTFVLLPRLPGMLLRYPLFLVAGLVVILLRTHRAMPNILVAQGPYEGVVAVIGRVLVRLRGIRAITLVEAHGDWEDVPRLFRRLWFSRTTAAVMAGVARIILKRADIIRVISDFTRRKVVGIRPTAPVVQFPTFTDLEVFLNPGESLHPPAPSPYILYVGMLVPSKGVEALVRGFAMLRRGETRVRLVLIGSGYAESRFKSLVQSLGLTEVVSFLPQMVQADLAMWMRGALCLVLPSLSEGLGRVLLEAMACGRPVIASRVGGIPEIIREGVNGFMTEAGDIAALRDRMQSLLDDPALADEMGRNGRRRAQELLSADSYFKGYAEVVEIADRLLAR